MERASASPARFGGIASLAGSFLLLCGILWLYLAPGLPLGESSGLLSGVFEVAGTLGVALTTASLLGLHLLLVKVGGPTGLLWATFGTVIVILSLAGLAWIFFSSLASTEGTFSAPFALSAAMVSWIRPLGILLFAFALIREDILFGRALLLFLICFLEAPLVSNAILYFAGPSLSVEWPVLLFGLPGVQTGLIGALAWAAFGYSLILLGREL